MKNLIYFTLAHNKNYLQLLQLCVNSLVNTGYDGDILFISNLENDIKNTLNIKNKMLFFDPEESSLISASANKLKIFQFPNINEYEKIIFCDLDILWLKSPQDIFDTIKDGHLFFSEEGIDNRHNMSLCYYSEKLITSEESDYMLSNNIIGLNAGFFGFHINMLHVFKNIFFYMKENKDKITGCLEQPFINTYCFRNKIYKTDFSKFVSHRGQDLEKCEKYVLHFAGGVGNFNIKYQKMIQFLNMIEVNNFNTRNDMFNSFPKEMKVMEIGVFRGDFSNFIFTELNPKELHMVDLFEGMMDSGDVDGNNTSVINLNESFESLKNKYSTHNNVFIKKGRSIDILNEYEDNYFDLIYIDGDHSYLGVQNDLELAFKKIKNGGYICGHDYEVNKLKTRHNYDFGVKQATDEFCLKYNQHISLKGNDGCISFGIKISK